MLPQYGETKVLQLSGVTKVPDFLTFISLHADAILKATGEHLYLALGAVLIGCLVSIPLGIWLTERKEIAGYFLSVTSIIQTVPSLAFLGFMLPLLGIGTLPALVVLILYSLLPILRNTYTGITGVEPAFVEAGKGMGMNKRQLLLMVKLPIAMPVIMSGIRISTVYLMSWATLAAFIGAGGLGDLILTGIQTADINFILSGAIPAALLTIAAGWILGKAEMFLIPRGARLDVRY